MRGQRLDRSRLVCFLPRERSAVEGNATALICGRDSMNDEWLNDTGIIVVSLMAAEK